MKRWVIRGVREEGRSDLDGWFGGLTVVHVEVKVTT